MRSWSVFYEILATFPQKEKDKKVGTMWSTVNKRSLRFVFSSKEQQNSTSDGDINWPKEWWRKRKNVKISRIGILPGALHAKAIWCLLPSGSLDLVQKATAWGESLDVGGALPVLPSPSIQFKQQEETHTEMHKLTFSVETEKETGRRVATVS